MGCRTVSVLLILISRIHLKRVKGILRCAFFPAWPQSVPAAGNGELTVHVLSLFTSMGVLSTAKHICAAGTDVNTIHSPRTTVKRFLEESSHVFNFFYKFSNFISSAEFFLMIPNFLTFSYTPETNTYIRGRHSWSFIHNINSDFRVICVEMWQELFLYVPAVSELNLHDERWKL